MTKQYINIKDRNFLSYLKLVMLILLLTGGASLVFSAGNSEKETMTLTPSSLEMMAPLEGTETAVFAGGCFWGVEAVFEELNGVIDVMSGYSGGEAETADYHKVGSGNTGHAESVRIIFDPEKISYKTLLEVFFSVAHDPTELNYQGPDVGSQYRSAVFYTSDEQKQSTEKYIRELESKNIFDKKIVTELTALNAFYPAEKYHQDFMRLNPNQSYIVYWDKPKIINLEKMYPDLLAGK